MIPYEMNKTKHMNLSYEGDRDADSKNTIM